MNPDIQTNPLQVISTGEIDQFIILVNWYEEPVEVDSINTNILMMTLTPKGFNANLLYNLEERIMAIQHSPSRKSVLALTTDGRILELLSGQFQTKTNIDRFSNDMLVDAKREVIWIAHDGGIAAVSNTGTRYIEFGTEINRLYRLNDDSLIAVGDKGLVLRLIDDEWQKVASSPTNKRLVSAFQSQDGKVWICGWGGVLFQWDLKSSWKRIKTDKDYVYSVGQLKNDIYVCCSGGVWMLDNNELKRVRDNFHPTRCYTDLDRLIFMGGGKLIHFNGSDWAGGDFNTFS